MGEVDGERAIEFQVIGVDVFQRLERDFGASRIFRDLPLIPTEWRQLWQQRVILRGDPADKLPGARGVGPKTAADL